MGEVIILDMETSLDIPAARVLAAALEADLDVVVVLGRVNGEEYFASSMTSGPEVVWLLERLKSRILGDPT